MNRFPKLVALAFLALVGRASFAAEFTQADLERMVAELDRVIPENAVYKYPVRCSIEENEEVNAYATYTKEGSDKRATMVVYTGIVKAMNGDQRLIRAVVAHELSHLSRGHSVDIDPKARDLSNLWTRQQEYEADKFGADALVKAGYSKDDMVNMLLFLDSQGGRSGGWLERLTADHADPKARAAEIAADPSALKALVTFDTALAYEDARSHQYAKKLFDFAAAQWPALKEASINAGKCALLFYYDNLPRAVRAKWWRPDFGPLLTNPHADRGRGPMITDMDREAWKDAMAAIEASIQKNPDSEEAKAMQALGRVLQPDAIKDVVNLGIDWFKARAAATNDPRLKLRYANNAAVGYHQLGDLKTAYQTIMDAQRGSEKFNAALGENLGLVRVTGRSKEDDELAANVLYTWLCNTAEATSPRWATVKKTFDEVCTSAGIKPREIKKREAYLCQVVTLVTGNKEVGLLLPLGSLKKLIGDPEETVRFAEKWPDLTELRWSGGAMSVLTERDKVMRITSYQPDAFLELKPLDSTSQEKLLVRVGMAKSDLIALLGPDAGVDKYLAKGGKAELWTYYPDLGMGVLIDGERVKAITVTPVVYEED